MLRVYATMDERMPLSRVADHARRAEALGYDGLNVPEAVHDGLLAAGAALAATSRLRVATSVIVAFPRSPMAVAHAAWDLQELSGGRFELGLGSQVRGNVTGRYSTAWAPPVPRMREYVGALRAIFDTWQNDVPLRFEGEHYRFTRMQPFFSPGRLAHPRISILLGGIGPAMTALAGEVADALVTHPTSSAPRYLREVVLPRLARGASRAGRERSDYQLVVAPLVATGETEEELRQARAGIRRLFGFLFSTPPYWPPLELFGWKERGERLNALSREGRWDAMAEVVSDEMLDTFSPCARYGEIAERLRDWYGGLADRITFPMPADPAGDAAAAAALRDLRAA